VPSRHAYDYLPCLEHPAAASYLAGMRVLVPVGGRTMVGIVTHTAVLPEPEAERQIVTAGKKRILDVLDRTPSVDEAVFALCRWTSSYYLSNPGETFAAALPPLMRQGRPATEILEDLDEEVMLATPDLAARIEGIRGDRRRLLASRLLASSHGIGIDETLRQGFSRQQIRWLVGQGLASTLRQAPCRGNVQPLPTAAEQRRPLTMEQSRLLDTLSVEPTFRCSLLHGITGSGKTEVYLRWIERLPDLGQVLVLVPEISLTPQLEQRFRERFGEAVSTYHSNQSARQRLRVWQSARSGQTRIVIGTRSAVFLGFMALRGIIVDEEHDGSFKQQESPRYHARDVAVYRAFLANIPVILGSATPSLESLLNCRRERYAYLRLTQRASQVRPPLIHIIDVRSQPLDGGLSSPLRQALARHIAQRRQALLFINKRGYAPVLFCPACQWLAVCRHCDARLTFHQSLGVLRCHHCDTRYEVPHICPQCRTSTLKPLGVGTESIEEVLHRHFPEVPVIRFDRDAVTSQRQLETLLARIRQTRPCLIVGTQLLAKGHDFPDLTLVGIVDPDAGLFSSDFRAAEKTAQLLLQVAGRAGRAEHAGEVLIQTRFPDHPLVQALIHQDYGQIADHELSLRKQAGLPPWGAMAVLRGEASSAERCEKGLTELVVSLRSLATDLPHGALAVHGPYPATVARRKGRFHAVAWIVGLQRKTMNRVLRHWLDTVLTRANPTPSGLRWHLDVDPVDTVC